MKAVIFGTGLVAMSIYKKLVADYGEDHIAFFIDSMLKKESLMDLPVYSLEELKEMDYNNYMYYFGTMSSQASMKEELRKIGVREDRFAATYDFSEDNFEKTVTEINTILMYPEADEEDKARVDSDLRYYLGDCYDDVEIDWKPTKEISEYDLVLIWHGDYNYIRKKRPVGAKHLFCIAEKGFYITIKGRILTRLYNKLYIKKHGDYYKKQSVKILNELKEKGYDCGYIFASGPSLKKGIEIYKEKGNEQSFRGVCNGFVMSEESIKQAVNPNLYFLVDTKFIGDVLRTITPKICEYIKNNDCYLVVPEHWVALLSNKFGIDGKVIGIGMYADGISFPTEENMNVYNKAANVITTIGIPIMSALTDNVYICGCDGTADKTNPVWSHAEEVDMLSMLKRYNETTTPIQITIDQVDKHELFFSQILEYGESMGKTYESITPSYIPCLAKRYKEK